MGITKDICLLQGGLFLLKGLTFADNEQFQYRYMLFFGDGVGENMLMTTVLKIAMVGQIDRSKSGP